MRQTKLRFMPSFVSAVSMMAVITLAQPCDAVIAKPAASGGTNNFAYQIPITPMPALSASYHYLLVDDWQETSNGVSIASGYINTATSGTKSELYYVTGGIYVDEFETYSSCTIRAHLLVNGLSTTDVYLVVKQGSTQDDGSVITVNTNYLSEYTRTMTVNPITSSAWTGADLLGSTIIGVKNPSNANGQNAGIADIVLDCE